jgi:hypothetical protein
MLRMLLVFMFCSQVCYAQTRFKFNMDAGAGWEKENFFIFNIGLGIEQKVDINKSLETGIYGHYFGFSFPKDQYGFYDAFVKGTDNEQYEDDFSEFDITFNFFSIPIGFNYYFSPKWYVGYKLGFNFFTNITYKAYYDGEFDVERDDMELFRGNLDKSVFNRFYLNHNITVNRIFLRRFELGIGFTFTPYGSFLRDQSMVLYRQFNEEISRYVGFSFYSRIYMFQIKSNRL